MAKSIFSSDGFTRGFSVLRRHGDRTATVKEAVHDGDTITVEVDGAFSIRFLGVDTPEVSFTFPELPDDRRSGTFRPIIEFKEYLSDPFNILYPDSKKYSRQLGDGLLNYLTQKINSHTALNHHKYAIDAQRELENVVELDLRQRVYEGENFRFFMAFAYEVMDRYGRFLCFVDRDNKPSEREGRLTYNERMLQSGLAAPYFIWPNINPFRRHKSLLEAVPLASKFKEFINSDERFELARRFVRDARSSHLGIYNTQDPLLLLPFELRYLARRKGPDRYVLDMSEDKPKILKPIDYHRIRNEEDRLFIDEHFVPLFENKGYHVEHR